MGCFGLCVGLLLNYVDYTQLNSVLNKGSQSTPNDIDSDDFKERLLRDEERSTWRSVDND